MKKALIAMVMVVAGSVNAQQVVSSTAMVVDHVECIKTESDSLVGTGVGGVAGAAAGRMLGGMFGGKTVGTLAGAGVGALIGNEMGKETVYTCEVLLKDAQGGVTLHTHVSDKQVRLGSPVRLLKLSDGRIVMK